MSLFFLSFLLQFVVYIASSSQTSLASMMKGF